jgi:hypothetical protein
MLKKSALKSQMLTDNPSAAERLKLNGAIIDALHMAEENERRGVQDVHAKETLVAQYEREHAEILADVIEGKASAEVAADKGRQLDEAKKATEYARKALDVLGQRVAGAKVEQERVAKVEARKAVARKLSKRADLSGAIEANLREYGRLWHAMHKIAAEVVATWPGGIVPQGGMTSLGELRRAIETENYRQNANPPLYGGQGDSEPGKPPTPPGSRCYELNLIGLPKQLPSLTAATAEANQYLLAALDGSTAPPMIDRSSTPAAAADLGIDQSTVSRARSGVASATPDRIGLDGKTADANVVAAMPADANKPAASKLSELLNRQAALAEKFTAASDLELEAAYADVARQIAELQ